MSDFNLPNFIPWKKENLDLENIFKEKKKLGLIALLLIVPLIICFAGYIKINSLQEEKKRHELELTVLRQSEVEAKKMADGNTEKLKKLSARVDNIITNGADDIDYGVLSASTTSGVISADQSTKVAGEYYSVNSSSYVHPTSAKNQIAPNSLGKVEIYDPVRKAVDVYKDGTTISAVITSLQVGSEVDYFKKTAGWYQIKIEGQVELGWVPDKNIREKRK